MAQSEITCGVCLDEVNSSEICQVNCSHPFHLHCILQWMQEINARNKCPMCRTTITEIIDRAGNNICQSYSNDSFHQNPDVLLNSDFQVVSDALRLAARTRLTDCFLCNNPVFSSDQRIMCPRCLDYGHWDCIQAEYGDVFNVREICVCDYSDSSADGDVSIELEEKQDELGIEAEIESENEVKHDAEEENHEDEAQQIQDPADEGQQLSH